MAASISPSSRKRKADDEWESYSEEDPITAENNALAKYYGSCSSTSSLSNSSSGSTTKKSVPQSRKKPNAIVRDRRHVFYGSNSSVPRVDSSIISLIPSKSTSWVWEHFHKFNPLTHPDKKGVVSCNICYLAAEKDNNKKIKFTVDYKVYITYYRIYNN